MNSTVRLGFDDLWRDYQALVDTQDACVVVILTRVISARGNRHQVVREALDTIGTDRVGADHHRHVGLFEECVQVICSE